MGISYPDHWEIIPPIKQMTILVEGGIKGDYEIKYVSTQLRDYVINKYLNTILWS